MEFWSFTVQDHSNFINSPVSIRDVDRKKATFKPSSNSIQYRVQHGHFQELQGITEVTTYHYFHRSHRIGPWTTSFCQGSAWKCLENSTVDQPAAELDSYWVRFPDNSILRRTRSMIKPRSLPSHFELQAEAQ